MVSEPVSTSLGENAYWLFISFLYASIIVDIAKGYKLHSLERPKQAAVISYLLLASFVVGTSWVAWTLAFEQKDVFPPQEVISFESLLLIVDFVILAMYFSFASIVGGDRESGENPGSSKPYHKHASWWVGWILTMYVVWDIFAYFLIPKYGERTTATTTPLPSGIHFWAHSWMSFVCASLGWIAFLWLKRICPDRIRLDRMLGVVMGDVSLIMLILFYRALKADVTFAAFATWAASSPSTYKHPDRTAVQLALVKHVRTRELLDFRRLVLPRRSNRSSRGTGSTHG